MLDRSRRIPASGAPWTHVCSFQGGRGGISPIASTQILEEPKKSLPFRAGSQPSRRSGWGSLVRSGGLPEVVLQHLRRAEHDGRAREHGLGKLAPEAITHAAYGFQ